MREGSKSQRLKMVSRSADKQETLGPLLDLPVTAKVTGRKGHTCLKTPVWVLSRFSKYFSCWSWLPGDLGAHSA